jgi:hypothetical protein
MVGWDSHTSMPIDSTPGEGDDDDADDLCTLGPRLHRVVLHPATAQQPMSDCDKWVARINTEVGTRVDEASHAARMKVDQIAKMCKDGQTVEAEKIAKETMATLGLKP